MNVILLALDPSSDVSSASNRAKLGYASEFKLSVYVI